MHSDVFFMHQQTKNLAGDPGEVFYFTQHAASGPHGFIPVRV
jgi:hypothetical protein